MNRIKSKIQTESDKNYTSNNQSCCTVSRHQHFLKKEMNVTSITARTANTSNMAWISAGEVLLGSRMKKVLLKMGNMDLAKNTYYMDRYAVTNEQFKPIY